VVLEDDDDDDDDLVEDWAVGGIFRIGDLVGGGVVSGRRYSLMV